MTNAPSSINSPTTTRDWIPNSFFSRVVTRTVDDLLIWFRNPDDRPFFRAHLPFYPNLEQNGLTKTPNPSKSTVRYPQVLEESQKKGEGNQKSGNRYLCWAYIEAANTMRRYCEPARKFHQRKLAKTNNVVATKALANKISKACYFMMRDKVGFDVNKIFK